MASGWRGTGSVAVLAYLTFVSTTFATRLSRFFELGLNIPEVAVISGHKDPRMLFRYTHLRAADLVDKIVATDSLDILTDRKPSDARAKVYQFYHG